MDLTVLVVEDELMIVLELEDILREAGFSAVVPVPTARQAIDWLEHSRPDVAIIDYRLKGELSVGLIKRLSEIGIPAVIYSGNDYSSELDDPILSKLEWVSKPSPPELITAAINRALMTPIA